MNNKDRLKIFENTFGKLHLARLCCDNLKVNDILHLINAYDFCNSGSNGEMTEREIRKAKDRILIKLEEI